GSERRGQVEADVGRRRAVRHHGPRVLLEVVRRQRVVLGTDEGFEEVPGPPRRLAQRAGIVVTQRLRAGVLLRQADPPPDQWREQPEADKGKRPGGRARAAALAAPRRSTRPATTIASATPPPMRRTNAASERS